MFSYFRIAVCRGGSVAQEGRQIAGVSSVVVDRVAGGICRRRRTIYLLWAGGCQRAGFAVYGE